MGISDFPETDFCTHKIKNWCFIWLLKYKIFTVLKNRTMCCRAIPGHLACKISGWYIYIWQIYSSTTESVDDVIFQSANLSISRPRTEIKWHFCSWDQTGSEAHTFYSKISIRKFGLMWPEVDSTLLYRWLAWGQIAKWLQFLNSTCKLTINYVPHVRKRYFWFWWPLMTFRDLTLTLTRT